VAAVSATHIAEIQGEVRSFERMGFILRPSLLKQHQSQTYGLVYHVDRECPSLAWSSPSTFIWFPLVLADRLRARPCERCV
jgi:hypothetical protein